MKLELGNLVRAIGTDFKGQIVGIAQYVWGETLYGVRPIKCDASGKLPNITWVVSGHLEIADQSPSPETKTEPKLKVKVSETLAKETTQDEETHTDDEFDLGTEEKVEEVETEITLKDVIKGFQTFAKKNGKEKAFKILTKYKVKSVQDLKKEHYPKVLSEIGA